MRKTSIVLALILLSVLTGQLFAQGTYNLPQVANGSAGTIAIGTTFIFFNNGDSAATVLMLIRDDDGDLLNMSIPGLGNANPYSLSLDPGETRFFTSSGTGTLQVGSATVTSTVDIGVSAIFALLSGDGSSVQPRGSGGLITEAGIAPAQETTEFAVAVDTTGAFNTGIAVQNTSGGSNTLTFNLFDTQGNEVSTPELRGTTAPRVLPGNGHLSIFVDGPGGLFPSLGDFQGKLVVSSTGGVAAITLRQKVDTGNPLTTLPAVPTNSGQTSFNLPQIAAGSGIGTTFVFFNLSTSQTANVTLNLTGDNGSPLSLTLIGQGTGSSFNFSIPPCGALFVETPSTGALGIGAARVTSNVPIGVSAIFTIFSGATIATEAGVGDAPALSDFTLPVDLTSGFNTGMALFNGNGSTANIQATLLDMDGNELGQSVQFRIDPFSLASLNHLAQFVTELVPGVGAIIGQLGLSSSLPISALTLRQGQTPSTLTTLPVSPGVASGGGGPGPGPMGSQLIPEDREGLTITSNMTINETLETGFLVSGTAELPGASFPFARGNSNQRINILSSVVAVNASGTERFGGSVSTFSNKYAVAVPSGSYTLDFCFTSVSAGGLPGLINPRQGTGNAAFIPFESNIGTVNSDREVNVTATDVDVHLVSGTVNLAALPTGMEASGLFFVSDNFAGTALFPNALPSLRGGGTVPYETELASGTYQVRVTAAEFETPGDPSSQANQTAFVPIGELTVSGPRTANFTVPNLVEIAGSFTVTTNATSEVDTRGSADEDDTVIAFDTSTPLGNDTNPCFAGIAGSFSEVLGNLYEMDVAPGTYTILGSRPVTSVGTLEEGVVSKGLTRSVSANTVENISITGPGAVVTVSGTVMGPGGPVADVNVDFFTDNLSGYSSTSFPGQILEGITYFAGTRTNSAGNYSIQLLRGSNYVASFNPPPPEVEDDFPFPAATESKTKKNR